MVPETPAEDPSPRFRTTQLRAMREYYDEHGYVVVQGMYSGETCDAVRALWNREIKPYRGHIYRQATARAERHVFNENGWVMNPILNLQSLDPRAFPGFRREATESILASPTLATAFAAILGEAPKVVQSMYFEGNSATWEHQDSYYLDSEKTGEMVAAWIAIEDIAARAGRFFICPGSHRIRLREHGFENNIAEHHEVYIQSVVHQIKESGLQIRAPALQKGDVLLWNSLTIHGSLNTQDSRFSRSSITCHAIPASRRFLQLQTRVLEVPTDRIKDTFIYRPKDLASMRSRVVFGVESNFPKAFYWAKKTAIKQIMRRKMQ